MIFLPLAKENIKKLVVLVLMKVINDHTAETLENKEKHRKKKEKKNLL